MVDDGPVPLVPSRTLLALVAVALGATLTAVGAGGLLTGPERVAVAVREPAATAVPDEPLVADTRPRAGVRQAVRLLRTWDHARAAAYEAGDVRRLSALYVPGADVREDDLALLAAYDARGVRVESMRMQLLALEVLASAPDRFRLLVTDRVHVSATGPDGPVQLRPEGPGTRVVVMVREPGGTWRVSAVRPRSGR